MHSRPFPATPAFLIWIFNALQCVLVPLVLLTWIFSAFHHGKGILRRRCFYGPCPMSLHRKIR
ncbi:uncharacterized protein K452DRAFT_67471 [Aplosporella prunicola CBS 121167]|uniref:Uncharacterized protein n=1 Tax=Aplosporella prunicola CBS 121167 TaxID=1176127 RepID=A0A6A6BR20_9PEZI|nr:uncharacterized protein K452DRAFT_67471 [Aplosporella prunicola CBS 121167]KAF2146562.1 hypothetical protein K452DRAFT_67471 [Aplosporella prunicola CBS 121167]